MRILKLQRTQRFSVGTSPLCLNGPDDWESVEPQASLSRVKRVFRVTNQGTTTLFLRIMPWQEDVSAIGVATDYTTQLAPGADIDFGLAPNEIVVVGRAAGAGNVRINVYEVAS